jgi:WhiB family redox-sensing transcriptional regulator
MTPAEIDVLDVEAVTAELLASFQGWMALGLCAQTDPELFFPEKGGSTREAKAICGRCEVRSQCLDYAIERNEEHGVWGGLSDHQRRRLRRERRTASDGGGGTVVPDAA